MKKMAFLRQKIEEMRHTTVKGDGKTTLVADIVCKSAKSIEVKNAAVALINTVLAMRQRWRETANPRVEEFKRNYSHIKTLQDLKVFMEAMSERKFCEKVLGLKVKVQEKPFWRYKMLKELVIAFMKYQKENGFDDDWEGIQDWAKKVDINELEKDTIGKIKNVGLATVQNLRLLCGIDTVKPDVHVKEALKRIGLGNDVDVVGLASELTGYTCRELDQIFWYWDKNRSL